MEKQWRDATKALKSTENNIKLEEMTTKLKNMDIKLISLRKQNKLMKEKMSLLQHTKPGISPIYTERPKEPVIENDGNPFKIKFTDLERRIQQLRNELREKDTKLEQYQQILESKPDYPNGNIFSNSRSRNRN